MDSDIKKLGELIKNSGNIVFFGGAGVSTESGIKDFRSADGLYNQKYKYPPERILSHSFFENNPEEYFEFHRARLVNFGVKPNMTHIRLAELEKEGKLRAVITQNIDGLHQEAGSKNVLELHGNIHRCFCARCNKQYSEEYVTSGEGVPRCGCGGVVRPGIVMFEEALDQDTLSSAVSYIRDADLLIVGGTSLVVYPAAGLIDYYRGDKLVLINREATARDGDAALVIREKIGEVFSQV